MMLISTAVLFTSTSRRNNSGETSPHASTCSRSCNFVAVLCSGEFVLMVWHWDPVIDE